MKNIYYLLMILIVSSMANCSSRRMDSVVLDQGIQNDPIEDFWRWFNDQKKLFEDMNEENRDARLDLVLEHLNKISDGLSVEISREFHGKRDIIISAEGDKNKFQLVKYIIKRAPKIQGWTTTAFRQKSEDDFVLRFEDLKFSSAEMFFYPVINDDSLDLIIYVDSIKNKQASKVAHYGLITMDNVLGEYDCVMKVRHYDFHDLIEERDKKNLKPLKELPDFIAKFYRNRDIL